jgi:ComF family protein
MLEQIKEFYKSFLHLVYPDLCIACGKNLPDINEMFCLDCFTELPFYNFIDFKNNEFTDRFKGKFNLEFGVAMFYFVKSGKIQNIIKQFKYHGKANYAFKMGELFGKLFADTEFTNSIDIIVPVPLHPKKEAKRGYNQSEKFASGISKLLNIPVNSTNLIRIKNTVTQTKMNHEKRVQNMQNAFSLIDNDLFIGKHILLLDDVLTTGSTLYECAKILDQIDGTKISMATIANGDLI